jgi:broad specificity phosphatase PhoE
MKLDDVLFFFVRHGETGANVKNVYRSWSNAPEAQLDAAGRKAAVEAGRYLATIGAPVELIVGDSLDRVQETLELVAQSFPNARQEAVRALHPLNMGNWTLQSKDAHSVEPYLKDTSKRIPGGETVDEFDQRQADIWKVIFALTKDYPGGRLLVGGHGSNVAYLNNHVFNRGKAKTGYEGLVDPGGVIAATAGGLIPLTKSREKNQRGSSPLIKIAGGITFPADHKLGMKVPKGGSNCAKCEYVDGQNCKEKIFIKWNGGPVIPKDVNEYCCDMFEPEEKS